MSAEYSLENLVFLNLSRNSLNLAKAAFKLEGRSALDMTGSAPEFCHDCALDLMPDEEGKFFGCSLGAHAQHRAGCTSFAQLNELVIGHVVHYRETPKPLGVGRY